MNKWMASFSFFIFILFIVSCTDDHTKPGYHVKMLSDMFEAVPYEAFSENPIFKDKMTLQQPVAGTIPRGFTPVNFAATPEGAIRAGETLFNPIPSNQENLDRGKFVYENFCLSCHGPAGDGDGQLIPRYPNPPSFYTKQLRKMKDGQIFHAITFGKNNMPSHASQIEAEDRWKIIHYIRELQRKKK